MKYIDSEKLIAEIERRIEETKSMKPSFDQFWAGQISAFKGAIKIAESLQQEEPPTEREIAEAHHYAEMIRENDKARIRQEQPKKNKNCSVCPHCIDRKDQNGWHFKGCFGGPYKGKFIAEIDECPLKQEQPEVDLDKEICKYFEGWRINYYSETEELLRKDGCTVDLDDVKEIARDFWNKGYNARKEE